MIAIAWSVAVMAASAVIIQRALVAANAMCAQSSHAIRLAYTVLAVVALGEFLSPLTGRVPELPEGAAMLSVALYLFADRRRPIRSAQPESRRVPG